MFNGPAQFDKNGNTGGCQAMYTMIANTTATPSCNNVTFPLGPLDVDATVSSGPLSQYGWIDEVPPPLVHSYGFLIVFAVHRYSSQTKQWNIPLHIYGESLDTEMFGC